VTRFWVGDSLVDPDQAQVSVLDHGLTVGDGVFETLLVRDGEPFALTRHLARLQRSLDGLGLAGPPTSRIREAVQAVLGSDPAKAPLALGRLRITVTSGDGPIGSVRGTGPASLIVTAAPLARPEPTTSIATVPWLRNERSAIAGVKSTSYAENAVALAAARRRGASEAVFANTAGSLCEGTGSNVFVVVGGTVLTPPLGSGCLDGVTRALVLQWCGGAVPVREQDLAYDVLQSADEVFLTSTTREVQPVTRIDDRDLAPGPLTAAVAAVFTAGRAADLDP
jgi:branched-chain amino acid aminotransferase